MIPLDVVLDAEGKFPEMKVLGDVTTIGRLPRGCASGKSSVVVEVVIDGVKHYAQTTMALLSAAVHAMEARDSMEASVVQTSQGIVH